MRQLNQLQYRIPYRLKYPNNCFTPPSFSWAYIWFGFINFVFLTFWFAFATGFTLNIINCHIIAIIL